MFYITINLQNIRKKLNYKYTNTQIIEKQKEMKMFEEKGKGYCPAYTRTDLTDDLHDVFGFRTDYEIIYYKNFEKFLDTSKQGNTTQLF